MLNGKEEDQPMIKHLLLFVLVLLAVLSAAAQEGTGLRGDYYNSTEMIDRTTSRTDATINFQYMDKGPMPGIPVNNFAVRRMGTVLLAGNTYDIRVEYYNSGGGGSINLAWHSLRNPRENVVGLPAASKVAVQPQLLLPGVVAFWRVRLLRSSLVKLPYSVRTLPFGLDPIEPDREPTASFRLI